MRKITKAPSALAAAPSASEIAQRFTARQFWPSSMEIGPGVRVEAHYHPIDEELVVVRGAMTFFDLTNGPADEITVTTGEALTIPEGTVHRVVAGEDGARYVMGLPGPMPLDEFRISLVGDQAIPREALVALVECNYRMAEVEEEPKLDETFFPDLLADRFVFVGALGDRSMKRDEFIAGLEGRKGRGRASTNLRLRREGKTVLASLIVTTRNDGREFLNARLFELETGGWRCVRWANTEVHQERSGGGGR